MICFASESTRIKIGLVPTRIVLAGGGARGEIWRRIKTDVINKSTVCCRNEEVTVLGAGILALVGTSLHKHLGEAVIKIVRTSDSLSPSPESAAVYEKLYDIYRETYVALKKIFPQLSELQS